MRKWPTILLCALACAKAQAPAAPPARSTQPQDASHVKVDEVLPPPIPEFLRRSALGSKLGKDGMVAAESDFVIQGQPAYLTMVFNESPGGLVASAEWLDANERLIHADRKPMNGAKVATFELDTAKLKPGPYHVVGYWGGNVAVNRGFEIVSKRKSRKQ